MVWPGTLSPSVPTRASCAGKRLRRHSDADPASVKLSTARLVIAREFGFAGWPRLTHALKIGPREPSVTPGLQSNPREPSLSPALTFEKAVAARALEGSGSRGSAALGQR